MMLKLCNIKVSLLCICLVLSFAFVNSSAHAQIGMYWKPEFRDYAPSGMPDFDQKQDMWADPASGKWTYCGPVAAANSLWWLDSEFEPGATPPPMVSDGFNLVTAYGPWDDHDTRNVEPFVNDLAFYMGTSILTGTEVHDFQNGLNEYLSAKEMLSYFNTRLLKQPTFEEIEFEVERCQDVVLLLGFWQETVSGSGIWYRNGGHYVTIAGIESATGPSGEIGYVGLSDPYMDVAEPPPHGLGSAGIVLPAPPHPHPPGPPDTVHNDALYVSHDICDAFSMAEPCPGGLWSLGYPYYGTTPNFDRQNFPVEYLSYYRPFDPTMGWLNVVEYAIVTCPWFAKGQYLDYAPNGMPDFDQKQDAWLNPWLPNPGSWSYCGPTSVANSLWWYDSKFEPNPVEPPAVNDGFSLVQSYATMPPYWDDHDPANVQPFIQDVAWYMDTDGRRTGLKHCGTDVFDMQAGIAQYLSDKKINPLGDCDGDGNVDQDDANIVAAAYGSVPGAPNWDLRADVVHDNIINMYDMALVSAHYGENWGKFYEKTMQRPDYYYLVSQITMCEDVTLLLGFWQEVAPGYFIRIGGHFVTAHGIDKADGMISISDPFQDNAENGGQGQVLPSPPHGHLGPPETLHNNASIVSHDFCTLTPSPSPGGIWGLQDYNWTADLLNNFYGSNTPRDFTEPQEPWMGFPIYVEIEYAVVISCHGPIVAAGSEDGNIYALDYMGNQLWTYDTGAPVVSVAMSEWGEYVVAGSLMNGLYVFDGPTGLLLWNVPLRITESYGPDWRGSDSKTVGISADGSYVVAATLDGVLLFDNTGALIWVYAGSTSPEESFVEISPDGRYVVSCYYLTGEIHFFSHLRDNVVGWQPSDSSPLWTRLMGSGLSFNWAAIDGCGRYIAFSTDADGDWLEEVYLFNRAGQQVWSWEFSRLGFVRVDMPWDSSGVVAVNADPSDSTGAELAYFSDTLDGTVGWSAADGTPQWTFIPSPDAGGNDLYSTAISPNGKVIATGPATTNIYLFSKWGAPLQTIPNGVVNALDLTFTGEYVAAGDRVEPALTGTIYFLTKTRNTPLWAFSTQGKINSVAIQKKYPCMMPFPYHDVDITNVTRLTSREGRVKTYVCRGCKANAINVTLSNEGDYTETVEVTLYAYSYSNDTFVVVGNQTVTITPGATPVVSFDWQVPLDLPWYGNYTLYATIGPVQDENHLADNEFIDSGLVVTGYCDIVGGNRKVDVRDVYLCGTSFGTTLDGPNPAGRVYVPDYDLNCDYKIEMKDYYQMCRYFGTNYP